jgi:hypothetical protein
VIPTCASWTTYTDSRVVCVWASCVCAESLVEKCGQLTADAKRAQNVARTHEVRAADARKEAEKYRRELDTVTVRTLSRSSRFAIYLFLYLLIYLFILVKTGKEREAGAGAQHPPQGQDQLPRPSRTNRPNSAYLSFFLCSAVMWSGWAPALTRATLIRKRTTGTSKTRTTTRPRTVWPPCKHYF